MIPSRALRALLVTAAVAAGLASALFILALILGSGRAAAIV